MVPQGPQSPTHEDEINVLKTTPYYVTESLLPNDTNPETLLGVLKENGSIGQMIYDISQGGVTSVRVTERKKLDEEKEKQLREFLDLDDEEEDTD